MPLAVERVCGVLVLLSSDWIWVVVVSYSVVLTVCEVLILRDFQVRVGGGLLRFGKEGGGCLERGGVVVDAVGG